MQLLLSAVIGAMTVLPSEDRDVYFLLDQGKGVRAVAPTYWPDLVVFRGIDGETYSLQNRQIVEARRDNLPPRPNPKAIAAGLMANVRIVGRAHRSMAK